jgi:hypothetical protein
LAGVSIVLYFAARSIDSGWLTGNLLMHTAIAGGLLPVLWACRFFSLAELAAVRRLLPSRILA